MNEIQKWIIVGAICLSAVSLFLMALSSRFTSAGHASGTFVLDKWTGAVKHSYQAE